MKVELDSPERFEVLMQPVAGSISIRPANGSSFDATVRLAQLERLGLFAVAADSIKVDIEPTHRFFSVTLALDAPFKGKCESEKQVFAPGMAHVLQPHDRFQLSARKNCRVLACNFYLQPLKDYASRLNQLDCAPELSTPRQLDSNYLDGIRMNRALARAWVKLTGDNQGPYTTLVLKELEDDLFAHFIQLTNQGADDSRHAFKQCKRHIDIAEEYLCANLDSPVTRDRLAEVAGVSIRTLSRAFSKRHGLGPLAFLKQRRFDATFRTLLGAIPEETSVTDVAMNFGFWHMGLFAIEYRQIFGESPSRTLRH